MLNVYKVKVVLEHGWWLDDIVVSSNIKDACTTAKRDYIQEMHFVYGADVKTDRIIGCVVTVVSYDI